ncbi:MAG: cytochrome P460 family protein [Nitrospira sp.]|nr:cytochrome P460 family protein [Nitrospira sp.]
MVKQICAVAVFVGLVCMSSLVGGVAQAAAPKDGEVALPADYASWPKFLSGVQREDTKQVRELYVNPGGAKACPSGSFPNGTRLVMELYKAKTEGETLVKGEDGKLVKGGLAKVFVMEKNEGWGQDVPDHLKNGNWVFGAYGPDGKALAEDFTKCRACHAPLAQKDFVHRMDEFCTQSHLAH